MSNTPTELSMSGMKFFTANEIEICSIYNLKMSLFIFVVIIIGFFIMSSTKYIFEKNQVYTCDCAFDSTEEFSNDDFYSYKQIDNVSYQSIPLTPIGESLVFGQVNRYIQPDILTLDFYCNLYILNGNIFSTYGNNIKNVEQDYLVYLTNGKDRKFIGKLKSGSDQVNKLKFTTPNVKEYVGFNNVEIVYKSEDKENLILKGSFP